ncbi:ferredoxin, partial [Megasphaera massiliensis]|nr:ferredoxin [Megasphaera massiliensis]
ISRIDAANKGKGKALQQAVRKDLLGLMETLFDDHPEGRTSCRAVAIAANTTMLPLLMGWSCKGLGTCPFTPVS